MQSTPGQASILPHDIPRQLAVVLWWTGLLLLVGLASLFAARRLAGGLTEPLAGGVLVALSLLLVMVAAAVRSGNARSAAVRMVPGLAAIALLAALTLPGTSAVAVALAWFVLAAGELVAWIPPAKPRRRPRVANGEATDEEISTSLVQSLTRERTEEGGESLHALVRAACETGDRVAVVHLAFCPPLAGAPELTAHVLDDSGAEVRITLAQSYGARIELRLPRPATPGQSVLVEVLGTVAKAT